MFLKTFAIALPVMLGGMWVTGSFGHASFERNVGRPQGEVMAALSSLDITQAPGAPGTDP